MAGGASVRKRMSPEVLAFLGRVRFAPIRSRFVAC
jgi:hypothetical protein